MKTLLRVLVGVSALLLVVAGVLWFSLTPPSPLELPEQGLALEGVIVVQPGEGRSDPSRIIIERGTIASVRSSAEASEFSGAYILPGLIDMHVHFPPKTGLRSVELFSFLFLYHGVTTVRDAADPDGTSTAPARDGVREGRFPGPRVFACGPLVDGPEPVWVNSLVVRTPAEAKQAVAQIAAAGFDCVKAYNSLDAQTLAAVREAAAEHGLPVIGHVPWGVAFEEARLDDVQHLSGVHPVQDPPLRFPESLRLWDTFDEERAKYVTGMSIAYDIGHTPTLVVLDRLAAMQDYDAARAEPDAQLLPRLYRDVVWSPTEGLPFLRGRTARDYAYYRQALVRGGELVTRMHRAGVPIYAGTDTQVPFQVPGASLHRELRLLAEAGLGPEGALAAATTLPGQALGIPGLGRVEPGSPADLLVFREDPTRDLAALGSLEAVIADGRLYRMSELEEQLARYRKHHDGHIFDAVSTALVRRRMAGLFAESDGGH